VITLRIKKRINTELFIHEKAQLYIQKWGANFLVNSKRVTIGAKIGGNENHYGSLFDFNYFKG